MRFVVVGGGIAGVTVAEELRQRRPRSRIVLFDAESEPLYSRMLLKEYVKGALDEATLRIHAPSWLEERGIEYRPGERVVGTGDGRVLTGTGDAVSFDTLFATAGGSQTDPFGITGRAENAFGLWTLPEARRIRDQAEDGRMKTAVVIGAGFLGLELADALAAQGVEVHYVMRGHWSRHGMGPDGAGIVHRALSEHGVLVHSHRRVVEFRVEEDRVVAVRTDRRDLPCDFVGLAVGLAPNVEYLDGTEAEVREGVVVDEHMRSADAAVYAAGDVAEYYDLALRRHRRTGTWLSAIDQARVAAAHATGRTASFDSVEAHSVAVGGLDAPVVFLGDWDGGERAVERSYGDLHYRRVAFRDGRPVGATLVGERGDIVGQLKQLIRLGPHLDADGEARLLDPHIDPTAVGAGAPSARRPHFPSSQSHGDRR